VFIRSVQEVKKIIHFLIIVFLGLVYFNLFSNQEISRHEDDEALLRTYIHEWSKFLEQSSYLPYPFLSMEPSLPKTYTISMGNSTANQIQRQQKRIDDNHVRKLMLDTWSKSIFSEIKYRLQNSAMKIIYSERMGEPFDAQLVVGVRESFGRPFFLFPITKLKAK
jgi:cullin-5